MSINEVVKSTYSTNKHDSYVQFEVQDASKSTGKAGNLPANFNYNTFILYTD